MVSVVKTKEAVAEVYAHDEVKIEGLPYRAARAAAPATEAEYQVTLSQTDLDVLQCIIGKVGGQLINGKHPTRRMFLAFEKAGAAGSNSRFRVTGIPLFGNGLCLEPV